MAWLLSVGALVVGGVMFIDRGRESSNEAAIVAGIVCLVLAPIAALVPWVWFVVQME